MTERGSWLENAWISQHASPLFETQQGRAHSRRPHPDWAARPAPMSRAARAAESKPV
jgi:hypothetical protein